MVSFISTLTALSLLAASATAVTHHVVVGQDATGAKGLVYTPWSISNASVGDVVEFGFTGTTHTATLSTFAAPCTANAVTPFSVGNEVANFIYAVNSTKPVWFYCATPGHCSKGMVFAINAPATGNTFEAFRAAAMGASTANGTSTGSNSTTTPGSSSNTTSPGSGTTPASAASPVAGAQGLALVGFASVLSLVGAGLLL